MKNASITKKQAEAQGWRFDTLYPGDLVIARLIKMDKNFQLKTEKFIVGKTVNDILKKIQESLAL